MERSHGEEGVEGKCRKEKVMIFSTGLDRVPANTHVLSASTAMATNFGCVRNAAGYND